MYSWKALILVVNAITSENRVVLSFSFMGMDEQQRGFGSFYWSEFWQNKGWEVHFWFFFSSFLMWKIQLLIWIFHIKKCEKNEDEVWIARPSCLVRERRSLQPWWGIHIHNFLLDRKTCKVLCKSVSRYLVGLRFLWTVTFTAAAVCYYLGEQEKKTQRRKAGPLGLDIVEV